MSGKTMIELNDVIRVVEDEPEFPGDMPDDVWGAINGNRVATREALVAAVRLTKQNIIKRLVLDAARSGDE